MSQMTTMTVTVPEEGDLGPAMKNLSALQRNFVVALIETGGNATNAAEAAGYCRDTKDPDRKRANLSSIGAQLKRNPAVVAAIQEESIRRLQVGSFLAVQKLLDLMDNPSANVALRAANSLLDRVGMGPTSQHTVKVEHSRSEAEIKARIIELAERRGLDPQLFLSRSKPVDVEFTEVADDLSDILA